MKVERIDVAEWYDEDGCKVAHIDNEGDLVLDRTYWGRTDVPCILTIVREYQKIRMEEGSK